VPVLIGNKVFFHMPKTGGTWVERYLVQELGGTVYAQLGGHAPAELLPLHLRKGKILFGTARHPVEWYASWYLHAINNSKFREQLRVYGKGEDDFEAVLRGVLMSRVCPKSHAVIWDVPNGSKERSEFLRRPHGLYSWAFHHVYGTHVRKFVRAEDLKVNLEAFLRVGINADQYPPDNLRAARPISATTDELYTDELRALVWEKDGEVARGIGYES